MMAQFAFGLLAGVIVGLVMEWVIDWSGLFPTRTADKRKSKSAAQNKVVPSDNRIPSSTAPVAVSSEITTESNEE
jgi:hypothetical protein